jgi:glycosyltransferase involved in cell wall biosynthesis
MRILWVKVGGLWPLTAGGRIRSFHIVRELSEHHEVTVMTTHASASEQAGLREALGSCARVLSVRHSPAKRPSVGFVAAAARAVPSPLPLDLWRWRVPELGTRTAAALASGECDVCIADFLSAVPNLPASTPVPRILFEHNVESMLWRRLADTAPGWQRPLIELEWRKLRRYERRACIDARTTLAVSDEDRAALSTLAPAARVRAIPTGVDTDYFDCPEVPVERDGALTFVGSMDWYPNDDAARYMIDRILPSIRRELPHATLSIVGRNPSRALCAAASQAGVQITGTVADVRPHLAEAAVVVVPLRVGGGTRLKIFEALAMGKAVVSTGIGAEGLPLRGGEHLLLADDAEAFARATVALLGDPARRRSLGTAGRELVRDRYAWSQVTRAFEDELVAALDVRAAEQVGSGR